MELGAFLIAQQRSAILGAKDEVNNNIGEGL